MGRRARCCRGRRPRRALVGERRRRLTAAGQEPRRRQRPGRARDPARGRLRVLGGRGRQQGRRARGHRRPAAERRGRRLHGCPLRLGHRLAAHGSRTLVVRGAGARPLPDPRRPRHPGVPLPAGGPGAVRRGAVDPRRPGVAGAPGVQLQRSLPVPPLPRCRHPGPERARLDRLRHGVPEAHPPRLGRRRAQGLRVRASLPRRPRLGRPGAHRRVRRVLRRVRHAVLRQPAARPVGGRGVDRRALEPRHVRELGAPDLAAVDGRVGRRRRDRA